MDGYIGEIKCFGGNYAPMNWMFCWGQILPIQQYSAVYALLGTQFGGDGRSNFALPDLRGRIPVTSGNVQGLTPRSQGQTGGYEGIALNINQVPLHNHTIQNTVTVEKNMTINATANIKCASTAGSKNTPLSNFMAVVPRGSNSYSSRVNTDTMNTGVLSNINFNLDGTVGVSVNSTCVGAGDTAQHSNMQPCLGLNFIICIYGYWPPRD